MPKLTRIVDAASSPETPIAETVRAMDDLVRQGKILYWGVSCWDENQIAEALRIADATNGAADARR